MTHLKHKIAMILESRGFSHIDSDDEGDNYHQDFEHQSYTISSASSPVSSADSAQTQTSIQAAIPLSSLSTSVPKLRKRVRNPDLSSSKNIMKNYARALANFAVSNIATPYIRQMITNKSCDGQQAKQSVEYQLAGFKAFVEKNKQKINCIKNLRGILLADAIKDTAEVMCFKELFQEISVVFMKFFSVNWLFSSKIGDKKAHLKYRMKLMRRVQNPKHFTYLEEFSRK